MKLTTRSEYALLALISLARATGASASIETIAAARGIPQTFLPQILLALKPSKYVQSSRGQHSGHRLAKAADKITLAEVIRLLDGVLAPTEAVSTYFFRTTPVSRERRLVKVFKEIRDFTSDKLEGTTVADVT